MGPVSASREENERKASREGFPSNWVYNERPLSIGEASPRGILKASEKYQGSVSYVQNRPIMSDLRQEK